MSKKKKKKIYTAFDGEIAEGMLVQCIKDDGSNRRGDIRRVNYIAKNTKGGFDTEENTFKPGFLNSANWRPIVRLPDGCLVGRGRMRDTSHPEIKHGALFRVEEEAKAVYLEVNDVVKLLGNDNSEMPSFERCNDGETQYVCWHQLSPIMPVELVPEEKPKHVPIYAQTDQTPGIKACPLADLDTRRKLLLAELVLECLNCDNNMVSLLSFSRHEKISGRKTLQVWHDAKCHPDDTPSALIGSIVALSKALGKDIPKWIFD